MSWIKVETHTPDKPEIFAMAEELGLSPDDVFGKCFRLWCWFDAHTTNGQTNGSGVSDLLVDRVCGVKGFANAMKNCGWLVVDKSGLVVKDFGKHNGESSKTRAMTAKRVQKHTNGKLTQAPLVNALPREREDKSKPKDKNNSNVTVADLLADGVSESSAIELISIRRKKRAVLTPLAWLGIKSEIQKAGLSLDDGIATMSKRGWQSFEAVWVTNGGNHGTNGKRTRIDRLADTAAELTGAHRARVIAGSAVAVD